MLEPGDPAPDVSARNQDGETVSPAFVEPTVVYFYPADSTPGCTTEAEQFTREHEAYGDAGVVVYGVSRDSVESHRAFAGEAGVAFDLLADPGGTVGRAFGLDAVEGRDVYPRTTFVLAGGEVERVYDEVDPDGHAREVLLDLLEDGLVTLE